MCHRRPENIREKDKVLVCTLQLMVNFQWRKKQFTLWTLGSGFSQQSCGLGLINFLTCGTAGIGTRLGPFKLKPQELQEPAKERKVWAFSSVLAFLWISR